MDYSVYIKSQFYIMFCLLRSGVGGRIDIGELTWEQREQVLRLLFAKMNGSKVKPKPPVNLGPSPSITHKAASIAAVQTPANR